MPACLTYEQTSHCECRAYLLITYVQNTLFLNLVHAPLTQVGGPL